MPCSAFTRRSLSTHGGDAALPRRGAISFDDVPRGFVAPGVRSMDGPRRARRFRGVLLRRVGAAGQGAVVDRRRATFWRRRATSPAAGMCPTSSSRRFDEFEDATGCANEALLSDVPSAAATAGLRAGWFAARSSKPMMPATPTCEPRINDSHVAHRHLKPPDGHSTGTGYSCRSVDGEEIVPAVEGAHNKASRIRVLAAAVKEANARNLRLVTMAMAELDAMFLALEER